MQADEMEEDRELHKRPLISEEQLTWMLVNGLVN